MDEVSKNRAGSWALWTALVLGGGLALRLGVLRELIDGPFWFVNFVSGVDMATHLASSRRILADFWQSGLLEAFYQSPLYAYELAGLAALAGPDPAALAYAQALMSTAAAWVVARLATRISGPAAGFVAALFASFTAQVVFYPLYLLPATLEMLCAALALAALHAAWGQDRALPWGFAGLAVGLALLARPNLAAACLVVLVVQLARARPGWARLAVPAVNFATGVALLIAPFVLRNLAVSGLAGLLPTSGAVNWRIGNSEDSPIAGFSYPEGKPIPLLSLAMVQHQASKLVAFFWGYEIPQNVNMYLVRESSSALWLAPLGLHHLFGLGLIGALVGRRRPELQLLAVWTLAYALSISAFFVVGRFRLPAVPALAVLSSVALTDLVATARARPGRAALLACAALLVTLISGRVPERPIRPNDYAIALDGSWVKRRPGTLEPIARRAARDYPGIADFRALFAATLTDLKRPEALAEVDAAQQIEPTNARAALTRLAYHVGVTRDPKLIRAAEDRVRELGIQIPTGKANENPANRR